MSRVRFARALKSPPFALLWSGQTISALGDGAYVPALAWQVLLLTHSSAALAAVVTATIVPRLIFLLLGGLIADRVPRRLVLFCSDAGRALAIGGIAALSVTGELKLWHLIVLGAIFGVAGAFFLPAYRAMPPQMVSAEALPSANALTELSGQFGQLFGPLLGATFVAAAGPATAFVFDALSFAVSAVSLYLIRLPPRPQAQAIAALGGIRGIVRELREAATYVSASPWLFMTIVIPAFGNAAFGGSMTVALPKLITVEYGATVWLLGAVVTSVALGRIAAGILVGQLHLHHRGILAFGADVLAGLALVSFGLPLPEVIRPEAALIAGAFFGFGGGTFQTIWVTLLHELVPNENLGRVASIDLLGSFCLQPVGFAAAGLVTDSLGPTWVFLVAGTFNAAL